jgi:hypothetical protein
MIDHQQHERMKGKHTPLMRDLRDEGEMLDFCLVSPLVLREDQFQSPEQVEEPQRT